MYLRTSHLLSKVGISFRNIYDIIKHFKEIMEMTPIIPSLNTEFQNFKIFRNTDGKSSLK